MSQFDENLSKIRSSEAACSSLSSMHGNMNSLKNLYDSIDELLLLPRNEQIFSQECQEQILDDYIRLLDDCSKVKDLIALTKQDIRQLLSAVKRKDSHGVQAYLTSRRKSTKMIEKSLKNLSSFRSNGNAISFEDCRLMLKDADSVTFSLLESLMSYVMGATVQERKSGWLLVSNLMHYKKVPQQGEETRLNEFKKLDLFLQLIQENDTQVQEFVDHLKVLDSGIQILEVDLEF